MTTMSQGKKVYTLSMLVDELGPPPDIAGFAVFWVDDDRGLVYTTDGRKFVAIYTDDGLVLDEVPIDDDVIFVDHEKEIVYVNTPECRALLGRVPALKKYVNQRNAEIAAAKRGIRVVSSGNEATR